MLSTFILFIIIAINTTTDNAEVPKSDADINSFCKGLRGGVELQPKSLQNLAEPDGDPFMLNSSYCNDMSTEFSFIKMYTLSSSSSFLFYIGRRPLRSTRSNHEIVIPKTRVTLSSGQISPLLSLVIRNFAGAQATLEITFDDITSKLKMIPRSVDFLVFGNRKWENWSEHADTTLKVEVDPSGVSNSVHFHAFAIVCEPMYHGTGHCLAVADDLGVYCQCEYKHKKHTLVLVYFISGIVLCITMIVLRVALEAKQEHDFGMEEVLFITCSPKTAKCQYDLCFKLGCPSSDLDMENTAIDFTLMAPESRVMCQCRIMSSHILPDTITRIHFAMLRLTPLSQTSLSSVSFQLSGGVLKSKLYFYGITIADINTDDTFEFPVNRYIRSVRTFKNLDIRSESQTSVQIKEEIPVVEYPQLHLLERIIPVTLIHNLVGIICNGLMKSGPYMASFIAILLGLNALRVLMVLYRYVIKYKVVKQTLSNIKQAKPTWKIVDCLYQGLLISINIVLAAYAIWIQQETSGSIHNWVASSFFALSVIIGIELLITRKALDDKLVQILKRNKDSELSKGSTSKFEDPSVHALDSADVCALVDSKTKASQARTVDSILSRFEQNQKNPSLPKMPKTESISKGKPIGKEQKQENSRQMAARKRMQDMNRVSGISSMTSAEQVKSTAAK